jgi:hypothetical protein
VRFSIADSIAGKARKIAWGNQDCSGTLASTQFGHSARFHRHLARTLENRQDCLRFPEITEVSYAKVCYAHLEIATMRVLVALLSLAMVALIWALVAIVHHIRRSRRRNRRLRDGDPSAGFTGSLGLSGPDDDTSAAELSFTDKSSPASEGRLRLTLPLHAALPQTAPEANPEDDITSPPQLEDTASVPLPPVLEPSAADTGVKSEATISEVKTEEPSAPANSPADLAASDETSPQPPPALPIPERMSTFAAALAASFLDQTAKEVEQVQLTPEAECESASLWELSFLQSLGCPLPETVTALPETTAEIASIELSVPPPQPLPMEADCLCGARVASDRRSAVSTTTARAAAIATRSARPVPVLRRPAPPAEASGLGPAFVSGTATHAAVPLRSPLFVPLAANVMFPADILPPRFPLLAATRSSTPSAQPAPSRSSVGEPFRPVPVVARVAEASAELPSEAAAPLLTVIPAEAAADQPEATVQAAEYPEIVSQLASEPSPVAADALPPTSLPPAAEERSPSPAAHAADPELMQSVLATFLPVPAAGYDLLQAALAAFLPAQASTLPSETPSATAAATPLVDAPITLAHSEAIPETAAAATPSLLDEVPVDLTPQIESDPIDANPLANTPQAPANLAANDAADPQPMPRPRVAPTFPVARPVRFALVPEPRPAFGWPAAQAAPHVPAPARPGPARSFTGAIATIRESGMDSGAVPHLVSHRAPLSRGTRLAPPAPRLSTTASGRHMVAPLRRPDLSSYFSEDSGDLSDPVPSRSRYRVARAAGGNR